MATPYFQHQLADLYAQSLIELYADPITGRILVDSSETSGGVEMAKENDTWILGLQRQYMKEDATHKAFMRVLGLALIGCFVFLAIYL